MCECTLAFKYIRMYCLEMNLVSHTNQAHYRICIDNLSRNERVEVELFDLPYPSRTYAVRVNGREARRKRFATKTQVWDRLRKGP
jgi:hypothetical protein